MAQGTLLLFEEFAKSIGDGTHDLDTNAFKLALITTIPTAADASPALGDYTEVSGTNYTAGGEPLTTTWTEASGTADFKHTGGTITWTQHASGPATIKAGLVYDTTSGVTNAAVAFIDFTSDGSTAISLIDGDITWTPEAAQNRIFSLA
jgi:hypothetical protein